jgi:hypothetical protein
MARNLSQDESLQRQSFVVFWPLHGWRFFCHYKGKAKKTVQTTRQIPKYLLSQINFMKIRLRRLFYPSLHINQTQTYGFVGVKGIVIDVVKVKKNKCKEVMKREWPFSLSLSTNWTPFYIKSWRHTTQRACIN